MRRQVTICGALLALLALPAFAGSYTFRSVGTVASNTNAAALAPGNPSGSLDGDLRILYTGNRTSGGATVASITNWTQLYFDNNTPGGGIGIYACVDAGTNCDSPSVDWDGSAASFAWIEAYSGDVHTNLATIVAHTATVSRSSQASVLLLPSLTITTDDTLVIAFSSKLKTSTSDDATTISIAGSPTMTKRQQFIQSGTGLMAASASHQQTTATNYDGTDFTRDGTNDSANGGGIVLSLVSAAGGSPPSFDTPPSCSATTNGVSCTYDASAASTAYGVCVVPADGAPSCTQIKAGQNDGGTSAIWTGSDSNTGSSDTITITGSNKPIEMDCHVCLSNGGGDSSVDSSQTNERRSARSGFVIQALSSLSASSIFDCATCVNGGSADSYFTPDVAVGDIIEYEDDTNEDADCNVTFEADGDFELEPVGADDCDGSRSFEISFQDISSTSDGLFNVGTFASDDTITTGNAAPQLTGVPLNILIAVDEAMTPIDLDARWTDEEGGTVTVTFPTTLPTGLSVSLGNLTGTPTACGVFTETERGTDPTGQYTEVEAIIAVGPRMPDLVGMTEAAAIAAIAALCP